MCRSSRTRFRLAPATAGQRADFQACANGPPRPTRAPLGQRHRGGGPRTRCAKLYHAKKQLSNLCYDWSSRSSPMLRFLRVKHLAVLDTAEIELDRGLNVLTGETGAGKSILVGAVGLLLGDRASGDLVRTGEESATVEAIFETGSEEMVVRREIGAQGRSRAFVNGDLATAGALK